MAVQKLSISVDEELADRLKAAADEEDSSVSAWIAAAVEDRLTLLGGLRAVLAYEEEHGAFTEEELDAFEVEWPD